MGGYNPNEMYPPVAASSSNQPATAPNASNAASGSYGQSGSLYGVGASYDYGYGSYQAPQNYGSFNHPSSSSSVCHFLDVLFSFFCPILETSKHVTLIFIRQSKTSHIVFAISFSSTPQWLRPSAY
jgi:hypothetical protein